MKEDSRLFAIVAKYIAAFESRVAVVHAFRKFTYELEWKHRVLDHCLIRLTAHVNRKVALVNM